MWLGFSIDDGGLTVSTNTQVDLLLEGVGLEGLGDTENGILYACAAHQHWSFWKRIFNGFAPISSWDSSIDTYRRTLGHVGPGRGMSGTDDHGAHVGIAGHSRAAGNTQGGEHCEWQ